MRTNLTGVPETMLWTLHNRATESRRTDGVMKDPELERIYEAIDYDYERSFGAGQASHSIRSIMFDRYIRAFLDEHPNGVIVNLGEGLETQRFRFADDDEALWISVDVPEAIEVREKFIKPDDRHLHVGASALGEDWYDAVPEGRPVYITAQGLLMYFEEEQVHRHLVSVSERFPGAGYAFDAIPHWMKRLSCRESGYNLTEHYTVPPCPWALANFEAEQVLRSWAPTIESVTTDKYDRFPRGFANRYVFWWMSTLPGVRRMAPTVHRLRFKA
ncbi:MAG: class I SAM-dependent methyltransferase [Myxococcota bacterium]